MSWGVALRNAVGLGLGGIPSLRKSGPYPKISFDFTKGTLDPLITFTRASSATYFDSAGVLQTAGNNVARFDYNPSTLAARGLLIEEQRTNSLRNNTMVGAVAGTPGTLPTNWAITNGGLSIDVAAIGTESGISYIDLRFSGTSTGTVANVRFEANTQITAASGQTWTNSVFIRQSAGSTTNITSVQNIITGRDSGGTTQETFSSTITSTLTAASISLNRSALTATLANASTARIVGQVNVNFSVGVAIDITLRIGLPQLEQGAFVTSVIPTSTTALTRSADVAAITGANFTSWFRQMYGTFYVEYQGVNNTASATRRAVEIGVSGSTNDRYVVGYSSTTQTRVLVATGAVTQADIYVNATQSNIVKTATAYAADDIRTASNGTLGTPDTAATLPTVSQLWFGTAEGSAANTILNGYIRKFSYYPEPLRSGTLQALTS